MIAMNRIVVPFPWIAALIASHMPPYPPFLGFPWKPVVLAIGNMAAKRLTADCIRFTTGSCSQRSYHVITAVTAVQRSYDHACPHLEIETEELFPDRRKTNSPRGQHTRLA